MWASPCGGPRSEFGGSCAELDPVDGRSFVALKDILWRDRASSARRPGDAAKMLHPREGQDADGLCAK